MTNSPEESTGVACHASSVLGLPIHLTRTRRGSPRLRLRTVGAVVPVAEEQVKYDTLIVCIGDIETCNTATEAHADVRLDSGFTNMRDPMTVSADHLLITGESRGTPAGARHCPARLSIPCPCEAAQRATSGKVRLIAGKLRPSGWPSLPRRACRACLSTHSPNRCAGR